MEGEDREQWVPIERSACERKVELRASRARMMPADRLLDIPCRVCGDRSSGKHYGLYSCDGKFTDDRSTCGMEPMLDPRVH